MKTLLSQGVDKKTKRYHERILLQKRAVDVVGCQKDNMKTTILTREDIRLIVEHTGLDTIMDEMIARLTRSFGEFDKEITVIPTRDGFTYHGSNIGLLEWMPAMQVGEAIMIKIVGYHPSNPEHRDIPTILSTVFVFDR